MWGGLMYLRVHSGVWWNLRHCLLSDPGRWRTTEIELFSASYMRCSRSHTHSHTAKFSSELEVPPCLMFLQYRVLLLWSRARCQVWAGGTINLQLNDRKPNCLLLRCWGERNDVILLATMTSKILSWTESKEINPQFLQLVTSFFGQHPSYDFQRVSYDLKRRYLCKILGRSATSYICMRIHDIKTQGFLGITVEDLLSGFIFSNNCIQLNFAGHELDGNA